MAVDSAMSHVLNWAAAPDVWWDQIQRLHLSGLGELLVRKKHRAYKDDSINASVVMGTVIFENSSIAELMQMTSCFEGSPREKYDTTIKGFKVLRTFESSSGEEFKITRSQAHPTAMGIISGREIDFVSKTCWLPDGRALDGGTSFNSPIASEQIEGCTKLEEFRDVPPSQGMVKGYVHVGAMLYELLEDKEGMGGHVPVAPKLMEEVPKSLQPTAVDEPPPRRRCLPLGKVCTPCLPGRGQRRPIGPQPAPPPAMAASSEQAPPTEGHTRRGRVRLYYIVSAEAGGSVPRWALDLALTGIVRNFIEALNSAMQSLSCKA